MDGFDCWWNFFLNLKNEVLFFLFECFVFFHLKKIQIEFVVIFFFDLSICLIFFKINDWLWLLKFNLKNHIVCCIKIGGFKKIKKIFGYYFKWKRNGIIYYSIVSIFYWEIYLLQFCILNYLLNDLIYSFLFFFFHFFYFFLFFKNYFFLNFQLNFIKFWIIFLFFIFLICENNQILKMCFNSSRFETCFIIHQIPHSSFFISND